MEHIVEQKEYSFIPIPAPALGLWWGSVEKLLMASPETWEDYYNLTDIYGLLSEGNAQLFVVVKDLKVEFALITQVANYPKCSVVKVLWCSGKELKKFLPLVMSTLDIFAKQVGANEVKVFGRRAWQPVLSPFGYEFDQVVVAKKMSGCTPYRM